MDQTSCFLSVRASLRASVVVSVGCLSDICQAVCLHIWQSSCQGISWSVCCGKTSLGASVGASARVSVESSVRASVRASARVSVGASVGASIP